MSSANSFRKPRSVTVLALPKGRAAVAARMAVTRPLTFLLTPQPKKTWHAIYRLMAFRLAWLRGLRAAGYGPLQGKRLLFAGWCPPSGLAVVKVRKPTVAHYCHLRACPWCYARDAMDAHRQLVAAAAVCGTLSAVTRVTSMPRGRLMAADVEAASAAAASAAKRLKSAASVWRVTVNATETTVAVRQAVLAVGATGTVAAGWDRCDVPAADAVAFDKAFVAACRFPAGLFRAAGPDAAAVLTVVDTVRCRLSGRTGGCRRKKTPSESEATDE